MQYEEIVASVQEQSGVEEGEAERTVHSVLQALVDRIDGKEGRDLLAQLPYELKQAITITEAQMPMTRDEFVARVARELQVNPEEARARARAVFATLRRAVTWGELEDVILELDPEYADLLA